MLISTVLSSAYPGYLISLAADKYYDKSWNNSPTAYTKHWGIKAFPHKNTIHEAADSNGSSRDIFYHENNVFWYPKYYSAPELWYNIGVQSIYKSGSTEVGTVGLGDWTAMSWILPVGQSVNGGYNSNDYYLSTSPNAVYKTTVGAPDLYWPLVSSNTLSFN